MVGTIYGGWHLEDKKPGDGEQIHEWMKNGEWMLGWHSYLENSPSYQRQLPLLNQVDVGDVLIAKQMDADFRSTWIKGIGICTEPSKDGHRLGVKWIKDFTKNPVKIDGSYRATIVKMSDAPKSRKLINEVIRPLMYGACRLLDSLDLTGCIMYGTLESCTACLGTAAWASLPRAVFGCYATDVPENPYEYENYNSIEHAKHLKLYEGGKIEVIGGVLRDECRQLMNQVKNWRLQEAK